MVLETVFTLVPQLPTLAVGSRATAACRWVSFPWSVSILSSVSIPRAVSGCGDSLPLRISKLGHVEHPEIRVYLPPSSSQRHTELCGSDAGWRSLPQGCRWKLGSWCGSVRRRMMSEGWVLVEDGEVVGGMT